MSQWDFNDGIVPFLMCIAMCVFVAVMPPLWESWKEARRKLAGWREYEIRIEAPDEEVKQFTAHEDYLALTSPVLRHGFEPIEDYVVIAGYNVTEPSSAPLVPADTGERAKKFIPIRRDVSQVFEHKGHGCIAVVISMHDHNESTVNVRVISSGSGWIYTSDRQQEGNYHFERRERDLISHHGNISFRALLEAHLLCRAEIANAGNFAWERPLAMEEVLRREEQYAQAVRDSGRHSPLSLCLWERRMKRQGHSDWFGELTGKVSRTKASDS